MEIQNLFKQILQIMISGLKYFPDIGELISFSVFLKELRNPIEKVFVVSTGQNDRSFENSSFARNAGFEIEYRTHLGKIWKCIE